MRGDVAWCRIGESWNENAGALYVAKPSATHKAENKYLAML